MSQQLDRRNYLAVLQYVLFGGVMMYLGRSVLVPLCYSALIAFILYPVCIWFERRGASRAMSIFYSVSILSILIIGLVLLLIYQVSAFSGEWPAIKLRVADTLHQISHALTTYLGVTDEQQAKYIATIADQGAGSVLSVLRRAVSVSATSAVLAVLVPIYTCLILFYRKQWIEVLGKLFPAIDISRIKNIASMTIVTYYNFIKGMGIVYLTVGILNTVGLLALGVPHAALFGFLVSILTIIPYVGILAGSLLPVAMAWIAHDSIWYPLGVVAVFAFVQYLEANVIFPFAVSSKLKVNTMVVLIAIFVGGLIWGVSGMILFVPFVGILKLVADQTPGLSALAMALGTSDEQKHPTSIMSVADEEESL